MFGLVYVRDFTACSFNSATSAAYFDNLDALEAMIGTILKLLEKSAARCSSIVLLRS
jgi:hypothetical protein